MKNKKNSFYTIIKKKTQRKDQPDNDNSTFIFGLGIFGLIGWSIIISMFIGIGIGLYLDKKDPGSIQWTLTFLILGLILGCINAWYWIKKSGEK